MVGPGAVVVERVLLRKYHAPKPMLRVKRGLYYVADCATVAEVAKLVDLGDAWYHRCPRPRGEQ
jgi:hypothetical protein